MGETALQEHARAPVLLVFDCRNWCAASTRMIFGVFDAISEPRLLRDQA